ncbi:MAG: class I SAM-dependent methyltransferase [Gammaproteobacteria bacterium]|nr:class I SAM-dependent methyltransferase [Gammaproteobacteria bacterium]
MTNNISENRNIVGNVYDKYGTRNPIARKLMSGFLNAVTALYAQINPDTILEAGCGEGFLVHRLVQSATQRPKRVEACDLSIEQVAPDLDPLIRFHIASIYQLPYADNSFELVVCCEVLEHLELPAKGLAELARVAKRAVLISAPREPLWRLLNLARGKYLGDFGNTPGHIQNFSRNDLIRLAETRLQLMEKRTPLPWTVLLGKPLA